MYLWKTGNSHPPHPFSCHEVIYPFAQGDLLGWPPYKLQKGSLHIPHQIPNSHCKSEEVEVKIYRASKRARQLDHDAHTQAPHRISLRKLIEYYVQYGQKQSQLCLITTEVVASVYLELLSGTEAK